MKRITAAAIVALAALVSSGARADNDGITRLTSGGTPAIPGITLDIGTGAVDRVELAGGVQAELDGIAVTDAAQDATLAAHGADIVDHGNRIGALETASASHAVTLADHEARIAIGEAKDVEQDARHDTAEATNATQDGRLDGHDTTLASHTGTLATHTGQIAGVQAVNVVQDTRLGSLETLTAGHTARLDSHDALLSQHAATLGAHGKRLDEQERGLAIAMSLPDAWLSDKKRFGVFGAIGGFGDETAIGFAAVGRLDDTWTLNAKAGTSTDLKGFGWQIGAGAQW